MRIVCPTGIVYEGETPEQARERDRRIAEHNREVDRWMKKLAEKRAVAEAPMKSLWPWCQKHAPWLLPEGER